MIDGDDGRPDFRYARSKAHGELEAIKAAETGLDVVIVNPGLRDRAGRRQPGLVVADRGVPARPAAVHRHRRPQLRRQPRRRARHAAGRGTRPGRRALHPHQRRRQPLARRLLRARRPGLPQAPPPGAHVARHADAHGPGGHEAAATAAPRCRRAAVERPLVVLHGGEGPRAARLHHPAAGRHDPRHRRVAEGGRLPPPLSRPAPGDSTRRPTTRLMQAAATPRAPAIRKAGS